MSSSKKLTSESDRVMGFKYRSPSVNCVIRLDAPNYGDITQKLSELLSDMNVDTNTIRGGGGRYNSYALDVNLYDEKEAQAIINDINTKLMVDDIRIVDATYTIKHPEIAESFVRKLAQKIFIEML